MRFTYSFMMFLLLTPFLSFGQKTTVNIQKNNGDVVRKKVVINNYAHPKKLYADLQVCAIHPKEIPLNCYLKTKNIDSSSKTDSFELVVHICNYGNSKAFKLIDSAIVITKTEKGLEILDSISVNTFDTDTEILPENARTAFFPINIVGVGVIAKAFLCFKIHYTDEKGKKGYLRFITDLTSSSIKPNIPLRGPNANEYKEIVSYLKMRKIW